MVATGQTANQYIPAGSTGMLALVAGTPPTSDPAWVFEGWVLHGAQVPAYGTPVANLGPYNLVATHSVDRALFTEGVIRTYTAIWSRAGVVGGANLLINNVPATMVATGQTANQYIPVGSTGMLALVAGTPPTSDPAWAFEGWALHGAQVPAYGTPVANLGPYNLVATHSVDRALFTEGVMRTYTAVWSRGGVVGGANLLINNVPATMVATGQTANQYIPVGSTGMLALVAGTPPTVAGQPWVFEGWALHGGQVPAYGTPVANLGPYNLVATHSVDRALFTEGVMRTYTAVWSRGGIVGGANLFIENVPGTMVATGQTANQYIPVGSTGMLALVAGTPPTSDPAWVFEGWALHGAQVPAYGTPVANLGPYNLVASHSVDRALFTEGVMRTYTAVWSRGGVVGGANLLINNVPATMVATGQTTNQYIPVGSTGMLALVAGTPPTMSPAWVFEGWALHGAQVPAHGTPVADLGPYNLVATHSVDRALFTEGVMRTYTAVWSRGGVVGGANLFIDNIPGTIAVTGQTATQYIPAPAVAIPLVAGTPAGDWQFFGWVRGDNLPAVGDNWNTWSANPANAPNVLSAPYATAAFVAGETQRFTAIWGNYDGGGNGDNGNGGEPIVGANLIIRNLPGMNPVPVDQTATQAVTAPAVAMPLVAGTPAGDWEFFGWVLGDNLPAIGDNWNTWSAANVANVLTAPYMTAAFVPGETQRFTAIWGNYDGGGNGDNGNGGEPIVGANLIIRNLPGMNPVPVDQTATQAVTAPAVAMPLVAGTPAGDWEFFGWVRGDNLPAIGDNWNTWSAANAANVLTAPYMTAAFVPGETQRFTAIWGNYDGGGNGDNGNGGEPIVGANLIIRNLPGMDPVPSGQTATQAVNVGATVPLVPGTPAGDWQFFGWVRGNNLPAVGADWAVWSAANSANVVTAPYATAEFVAGQTQRFTAIWGNYDGGGNGDNGNGGRPIVGANLIIRNLPGMDPVPSGQTATQAVNVGATVPLVPGTPAGDWQFFGWVRGDNLPAVGDDWTVWSAANSSNVHTANATPPFAAGQTQRFTAIWGNYDGGGNGDNGNGGRPIVGANLIIRNQPNMNPVPSDQTATQAVDAGATITLLPGTLPATVDLEFDVWVLGNVIPPVGVVLVEWLAANPSVQYFADPHAAGPFAADEAMRFTAIWTRDGIVGGANLRVENVPDFPTTPAGQTASQFVSVGSAVTLVAGTSPDPELSFARWIRGDVVPPVGVIFADWLAANPVPNFGAGHRTNTFAVGSRYLYTAVWVCEDGIVGGGANLRIYNVPAQLIRPAGQTPNQVVPVGESRTLAHGAAPDYLLFGTWIRGNVVPPLGANLDDWLTENPTVEYFAAGHTTNTFADGSRYTYYAIWVCENRIVGGGGYRAFRIYYYVYDDGLERDTENNPYGREYTALVGSIFDLSTVAGGNGVLDRNDLDSDNEYYFEGWIVTVGGIQTVNYLADLDLDELNGTFTVPAPTVASPLAVAQTIIRNSPVIVGDTITLTAIWSIVEDDEKLPQTGIESNILLWAGLLLAALLTSAGALVMIKENEKRNDVFRNIAR